MNCPNFGSGLREVVMTKAEELKQIDEQLADANEKLKIKQASVRALESFIDQKIARRWQLQAEISQEDGDKFEQRDNSQLIKPRGKCVTIDGWDV